MSVSAGTSRRELLARVSVGAFGAAVLVIPAAAGAATVPMPDVSEFEDVIVDRGDAILAARVIGSGDLILIHPSLGRGARDFDPLADLLAAGGYRVASFDPRGTGQSTTPEGSGVGLTLTDYAEDMLAVMQALGEPRAHVVGHAYGNRVARMLATIDPEATRTVTLCACGDGSPGLQAQEGIQTTVNPATPIPQFKAAVKSTFFAPTSDPSPWYIGWYDAAAEEETYSAASESDDYAAGGVAPMLIIQGLQDIVAPPSIGQGLKSKYGARVELYDLEGCAHALIIEKTAEIAAIMLDYLARHAPPPGIVAAFHSHGHNAPVVALRTTTGTLAGVDVNLLRGSRLLARARIAQLTTTECTVRLVPTRGTGVTAGSYTLSISSYGRTLLKRKVGVT
jgi:pimeloyl-ACP methyl ester carboxylesterase